MPIIFRLALLADLVSVWCEACFPGLAHTALFSADHVARLMVLLLGAAILVESAEILKGLLRRSFFNAQQHPSDEPLDRE